MCIALQDRTILDNDQVDKPTPALQGKPFDEV